MNMKRISIKEELPELGKQVIVAANKKGEIVVLDPDSHPGHCNFKVSYWISLPDLPTG